MDFLLLINIKILIFFGFFEILAITTSSILILFIISVFIAILAKYIKKYL